MSPSTLSWLKKLVVAVFAGVAAVPAIMHLVPTEYQPVAYFLLAVVGYASGVIQVPPGSIVIPAASVCKHCGSPIK
jgi:hypothetical protein